MSVAVELVERRSTLFGVALCLSNKETRRLDKLATGGPEEEMRALCMLCRIAERNSAPRGNGHKVREHHVKKQSKQAATARVSRVPMCCRV